ncbi:MAG: hypothetical protein NDI62_00290 [Burkholderiales bacterium]|nr:hypothetical protein [Burkholderiales bacterium]
MEPNKKSNGALIGSIIIILILVIGGIYIWQSKTAKEAEMKKIQEENLMQLEANELKALEQYLNETDTEINIDLNNIN